MNQFFVLKNQHEQYLNKHNEWVDGSDTQSFYRTAYKDEAINVKVEHAVRSPDLRLSIVTVTANQRGQLQLNDGNHSSIDLANTDSFTADSQINDTADMDESAPVDTLTDNPLPTTTQ